MSYSFLPGREGRRGFAFGKGLMVSSVGAWKSAAMGAIGELAAGGVVQHAMKVEGILFRGLSRSQNRQSGFDDILDV
jgi:hypothetical protein